MKTNPVYRFENQRGEIREVTRVEEAKAIIIATAMVRGHNRDNLFRDNQIIEVAEIFGLNLGSIVIEPTHDPNGFPYSYHFKEDLQP